MKLHSEVSDSAFRQFQVSAGSIISRRFANDKLNGADQAESGAFGLAEICSVTPIFGLFGAKSPLLNDARVIALPKKQSTSPRRRHDPADVVPIDRRRV